VLSRNGERCIDVDVRALQRLPHGTSLLSTCPLLQGLVRKRYFTTQVCSSHKTLQGYHLLSPLLHIVSYVCLMQDQMKLCLYKIFCERNILVIRIRNIVWQLFSRKVEPRRKSSKLFDVDRHLADIHRNLCMHMPYIKKVDKSVYSCTGSLAKKWHGKISDNN
jgi:hypothetical protein